MSTTLIQRAPEPVSPPAEGGARKRSLVLGIILATYLMIILDSTLP